jgi:hypothetical protein
MNADTMNASTDTLPGGEVKEVGDGGQPRSSTCLPVPLSRRLHGIRVPAI